MNQSTVSMRAESTINQSRLARITIIVALVILGAITANAQTSSFPYQGRLTDGGTGANGNYDLQFALWDSAGGGTQIGSTVALDAVPVSNGIFTVSLDFGAASFNGAARFLEISARPSSNGSFVVLSPRQQIVATPYAIRTLSATTADALSPACAGCIQDSQISSVTGSKVSGAVPNADNATNAGKLGGVDASQYIQTNDSRLTDSRSPTPGSSNYIQNTSSAQSAANFNISGNGTAGGTLSSNIVNASTQFNLNGNRVLSVTGAGSLAMSNTFVGVGAGTANTPSDRFNTGNLNSFFGANAGAANTTGTSNSFFGSFTGNKNTTGGGNSFFGVFAGNANTTGYENSFFGDQAGAFNTTGIQNSFFGVLAGQVNGTGIQNSFFGDAAGENNSDGAGNSSFGYQAGGANGKGSNNSFFGKSAGLSNTTENNNTFLGALSNGASGISNATAIGSQAQVTQNNSLVLGSIKGTNGATADTSVGIGIAAPAFRLHVVDSGNTGLRVQTNVAGGTVASFGGFGAFQIDSNGTSGGRLNVQEGGNVGIGTNQPNTRLDVAGNFTVRGSGTFAPLTNTADLQIGYGLAGFGTPGSVVRLALQPYGHIGGPWRFTARDDANKAYLDWVYGPATTGITQDSNGKVGIGTLAPDALLSVNGSADKPGGGSWGTFSDERLKNIKGRFTPGLNAVMALQPLRYEYKPDNALGIKSEGEHIGFSAQQVQRIIPQAVRTNDQGYLLVDNDPILWTMLNAIKEQQAQIQRQEDVIKSDAARLEQQQRELAALKKLVCRPHRGRAACR